MPSPEPSAILEVRVVPNARATSAEGFMDDGKTLKIRLAAPPVEGKANEALERWLAESLGLRRKNISIVGGEKSRAKRVRIVGLDFASALARLGVEPRVPPAVGK